MSKILVCGDLHTKYDIFSKVKELARNYDKVVFLGDYVDEWDAIPEASYNLLWALVDYKKSEPDKVVLLLGNHDLSEWFPPNSLFHCSGRNSKTSTLVKPVYSENASLFQIAYSYKNYLFTHAGLTSQWAKDNKFEIENRDDVPRASQWAYILNSLLLGNQDFVLGDTIRPLATAGYMRGGIHAPSPLWADEQELKYNPIYGVNQIVGHTPQRTTTQHIVTNGDGTKTELWFCDTHSLMPSKEPIGDSSLLSIEDDTITILKDCLA